MTTTEATMAAPPEQRAGLASGVGLMFWAWVAHGLMLIGGQVAGQVGVRLRPLDPFALVALVELATLALMILGALKLPGRGLVRVLAVAAAAHLALSVVDALTPNYDASPLFGTAQRALLAIWIVADVAGLALLWLALRRHGAPRGIGLGAGAVALLVATDLGGLARGLVSLGEPPELLRWAPVVTDLAGTVLLVVFLGQQHAALAHRPRPLEPLPPLDLTARLALAGWRGAATGLRGFGNVFLAKVVLVLAAGVGLVIFAAASRASGPPPAWLPLPLGVASLLLSARALSSLHGFGELPEETGARPWVTAAVALLLTAAVADVDSLVAAVEALVPERSSAGERVLGGQLLSVAAVGVALFVLLVALGRAGRFLGDAAINRRAHLVRILVLIIAGLCFLAVATAQQGEALAPLVPFFLLLVPLFIVALVFFLLLLRAFARRVTASS